jgi:hypothetical protein
MTADIERIIDFIVKSFIHVWPYLLLSIPLAVGVKMSGASRHIKRAFDGHPAIAILLAVAVGAFSPFERCKPRLESGDLAFGGDAGGELARRLRNSFRRALGLAG